MSIGSFHYLVETPLSLCKNLSRQIVQVETIRDFLRFHSPRLSIMVYSDGDKCQMV